MIEITESKRDSGDMSTVFAFFRVPIQKFSNSRIKWCDSWSSFDLNYDRGAEYAFIEKINAANSGKYSHYHIGWYDSK